MPFYQKGNVRIRYEETGSGFPLLLIAGGGLNSNISYFTGNSPFNPMEEFKGEYRCIAMDLRNANGGESAGPLEIERPWDSYADDQLGLMDHLGHQGVPGDGLLHRRPLHLEPAEAGAGACHRRRAGAAERVPSGNARSLLHEQHHQMGAAALRAPARRNDGDGRQVPEEHVRHQPRLRLHRNA